MESKLILKDDYATTISCLGFSRVERMEVFMQKWESQGDQNIGSNTVKYEYTSIRGTHTRSLLRLVGSTAKNINLFSIRADLQLHHSSGYDLAQRRLLVPFAIDYPPTQHHKKKPKAIKANATNKPLRD